MLSTRVNNGRESYSYLEKDWLSEQLRIAAADDPKKADLPVPSSESQIDCVRTSGLGESRNR